MISQKFDLSVYRNKEKLIKYGFLAISILISSLIIYFKDELSSLSNYGYLGIFLISILGNATVVVPAPVIVTAFVGGAIYNPILVGLLTGLGATIGEVTGYLAGAGSQTFIEDNKYYKRVEKWMSRSGFLTIFILAAIPNPLFDVAGMFSGATKYPLKKFLLATLLGKSLKFLVIAFLGKYSFL